MAGDERGRADTVRLRISGSGSAESGTARRVVAAGVAACVFVAAAWQAVTLLATPRPPRINYWQDDAVVAALDGLKPADAAMEPAAVRSRAEDLVRLLRRAPLERRAVYALVDLYRAVGDEARAGRLERLAVDMSLRNGDIQLGYISRQIARGAFADIVGRLDGLIRIYPDASAALLSLVANLTIDPAIRAELITTLKAAPPWRAGYLRQLRGTEGGRDAYFEVYRALTEPQQRLSAAEIGDHIDGLLGWGMVEEAWQAWVDFNRQRSIEVPYGLFDPHFTREPDNMAFGWYVRVPKGVIATFAPHLIATDQRVLQLQFLGDRNRTFGVQQFLRLQPGPHVFSGRVQTSDLQNPLGIVWRLYCRSRDNTYLTLATSRAERGSSAWHEFQVEFTVPDSGCETQILRPETKGFAVLDTEVTGIIEFSDLTTAVR
jgi:hypothetical protein